MGAAGVHPGPFHAVNWWLRGGTKDRFGDDWPCHAPVHATAVWSAPLTVDVHGSLNGIAPQHQTSVRKVSSRSRGGHLHSLSCAWSFCALLLLHRGSSAAARRRGRGSGERVWHSAIRRCTIDSGGSAQWHSR